MNYPMRSIAFISEMIHPPVNHDPVKLQKLHSAAFEDQECQYQNFQMLPAGAQMSNPQKKRFTVSSCTMLNDRIQVREEMTGISREDYEVRLNKLAQLSADHLNIPAIMVQQFVVRALINPRHYSDSKEFISSAVINMEPDNFTSLDMNTEILGIRMALSGQDRQQNSFNLRIESYSQDPRSLFIENIGSYRQMVDIKNMADVSANFTRTYSFIENNVLPFINQFDEPSEN